MVLGAGRWHLHAVVVGALSIEVAAVVVDAAVVQGAEAHEAVLQGVVALLVHVVVPDHILLTREPLPGDSAQLAGALALNSSAKSAWTRGWHRGPSGHPINKPSSGLRLPS